jgi:hypothetical protein
VQSTDPPVERSASQCLPDAQKKKGNIEMLPFLNNSLAYSITSFFVNTLSDVEVFKT